MLCQDLELATVYVLVHCHDAGVSFLQSTVLIVFFIPHPLHASEFSDTRYLIDHLACWKELVMNSGAIIEKNDQHCFHPLVCDVLPVLLGLLSEGSDEAK
jgi:hypothetical protein